jgi:hypothetical protein
MLCYVIFSRLGLRYMHTLITVSAQETAGVCMLCFLLDGLGLQYMHTLMISTWETVGLYVLWTVMAEPLVNVSVESYAVKL